MIISHQKKFIFIHNYKVAGTSIRQSLELYDYNTINNSTYLDKLKLFLGISPKVCSSQFEGHITAVELKDKIPHKIFNDYYKFGFVRNPWDWQVSLYKFMLKLESHPQHTLIKSMKNFDEYIDWRVHEDLHLQKDFFYENNVCLMDFIGRFKNLKQGFGKVCKKIDIKVDLPHLNKSRKDNDFLKYYSKTSLDMVYQAFEEDIKLFAYSKPEL